MSEELQGLVARENDLDSEHEEDASPKGSLVETATPRNLATLVIHNRADPVPLFGMPTPSMHANATSVKDSVSCTVPK